VNLLTFKAAMVAFIIFLLAVIGVADAGWGPQFWGFLDRVPAGDKFGHFALFGILAFLVNGAMRAAEIRVLGLPLLKGSVFILIAATLEEVSQVFFRARSFDLGDLLADVAAVLVGGWLARVYLRRRMTPE
jgi:polysaccharide biosynthesis protein VpsQ